MLFLRPTEAADQFTNDGRNYCARALAVEKTSPPLLLALTRISVYLYSYGSQETVGDHVAGVVPVDQLTPDQLKRFRAWKRSRFERDFIREVRKGGSVQLYHENSAANYI